MLVNGSNLRTLGIGFSAAFQGGLGSVAPTWQTVAMKTFSNTAVTEYGWLGRFPRIREWVGDRVLNSLSVDGYRIRNRRFEGSVSVAAPDIERDNIGIYTPMFAEMGRATAAFPDELVWPLLAAGFVTPCYDGQYFFDVDHPVLDASGATISVSNTASGSGPAWYLLDTTRVVRPIIYQEEKPFVMTAMDKLDDEAVFMRDEYRYGVSGRSNAGYGLWQLAYGSRQPLTPENYAAARAAMTGQLGDYGRPLGIVPKVLAVPPALEIQGRKILLAEQTTGGETNVWRGTADLHVEPWLS